MRIYIEVFKFLREYQPYSIYYLLLVFLITAILEAIGISFVMPVIALVLDENFLQILSNSSFARYVPEFILEMTRYDALFLFSFFVIFTYLIKNIFLIYSEYLRTLFTGIIKAKLSSKIMNKYLHQDILYHSKKSNSEINSTINQKINDVTDGLLTSVLTILSELIVIIGLLFLIIFFKQLNTFLILLLLFTVGVVVGKIVTIYIKKLGVIRQHNVNIKFNNFTQITNNFREILLTGRMGLFFVNFRNSLMNIAKFDALRSGFQKSPQLIFETIGVSGLVVIIYYLLSFNASTVEIIATCTFFAAISYRAIPSLHKILHFYYNVKYYLPTFLEVVNELNEENKILYHEEKFDIKSTISLQNISFKYEENNDYILKNLNFDIKKNISIGIYGKSGCGKTTLLDLVSGLIEPSEGEVVVEKINIDNNFLRRKLQNNISYTSQKTSVINGSLKKNICFGEELDNIDNEWYKKVLEISHLTEFEKFFDDSLKQNMSDFGKNISGGQLQRVGIARALYQSKDILIFDESTNALDENLEKELISDIIKLKNKTIIFVSHNLDLFENFHEIYQVKNQNILKIK